MRWYERLRRRAEILHVRRRGRRAATGTLAAYAADAPIERPRVGITVSKAVGNAVVRNRVRRRIRGALDALGPLLSVRTALLIVVRPEAAAVPYAKLAADILSAIKRLGAVRGG